MNTVQDDNFSTEGDYTKTNVEGEIFESFVAEDEQDVLEQVF